MPRRSPLWVPLIAFALGSLNAWAAPAPGGSTTPFASVEAGDSAAAAAAAPAAEKAGPGAAAKSGPSAADEARLALPTLQQDTLLVELSTAGYYELVSVARSLGLSDSGSADELRSRLYDHYGLKPPVAGKKGRIVTIERAGEASYAKVAEEEGGIVRATGGVIVTLVEENGDSHRIEADSVVFNRARSTLTARGSVRYERKSGSAIEIFEGEVLNADLNDWSGVFLDGKIRNIASGKASGERGLVVQADTIVRRSADVMVLENGVISSSDADDPYYAVKAKRVWLLGDKEWALADAVLSLGNVPVLWLPFFYYPGNEIVFHPVIGFDSREGTFLQTTVYLIGAKPPSTKTTTILSMQNSGPNGPTKLKGLFLEHASGPVPKDQGTLKTMADLYSGLGLFGGVAGSFPKLGVLGKTDLYAGLGYSRSLFAVGTSGNYSPFIDTNGYDSIWNSSAFLGKVLPFRFGFNFATAYTGNGLTASLALPVFSDPYFQQDFTNRSEDMNWFQLFNNANNVNAATTIPVLSLLNPKLETSYSLKPKALDPWISSIDVTKLSIYALLPSKSATNLDASDPNGTLFNVDPNRTFFYPSTFRPFDVTLSLKGSLVNTAQPAPSAAKDASPAKDAAPVKDGTPVKEGTPEKAGLSPKEAALGLAKEGDKPKAGEQAAATAEKLELRSPWTVGEEPAGEGKKAEGEEGKASGEKGTAEASTPETDGSGDFKAPAALPSSAQPKAQTWTGSLGWTLSPSAYYEDSYLGNYTNTSVNWATAKDINFAELYELFSYKLAATMDGSISYGDYLSSTLSLSYADQRQQRPYLYDDGSGSAATYTLADNLFQSRLFSQTAKLTLKPFASSWLWSATSLSWDMTSTIYGYKYDTTSSSFQSSWISWDPATITAHDLSLALAVRPENLTQSLTLTAALPPVLDSYSAKLGLDASIANLSVQSRMFKPLKGAAFSFDPITSTLSIGKTPFPVLTDTFVYDGTTTGPQTNVAGLAWGPATASISSARTQSYMPVLGTGWQAYGDTNFGFSSISIGLSPTLKSDDSVKDKAVWSLGAGLTLSQSLVRFSEATLGFNLSASYKLGDSLNLTLSSQSLNSAAWKYYPQLFSGQLAEIGQTPAAYAVNPLADIWDGLSIWNSDSLRKSLFKLKSLSLSASQDLHDWTLSAQISTAPLYDATTQSYSLDTTFTILLTWKDIPDIKTKLTKISSSSTNTDNTISY